MSMPIRKHKGISTQSGTFSTMEKGSLNKLFSMASSGESQATYSGSMRESVDALVVAATVLRGTILDNYDQIDGFCNIKDDVGDMTGEIMRLQEYVRAIVGAKVVAKKRIAPTPVSSFSLDDNSKTVFSVNQT